MSTTPPTGTPIEESHVNVRESQYFKEGYNADRLGYSWWDNPYAEVKAFPRIKTSIAFKPDWFKAALWWKGYSQSRQDTMNSYRERTLKAYAEIEKIVKQRLEN